jgi:hypothetical protein
MPRPAKTLLVGTIAAIPLWLTVCGAASSQSTVTNNQVQTGDIFAGQSLNVVTASDDTATVTATGNAVSGSVASGDLALQSQQVMSGATAAQASLVVGGFAGSVNVVTAATGNTGDSAITSGGTLLSLANQQETGTAVTANTTLDATNAQVGQGSIATQAVANSWGLASADSAIQGGVTQINNADTTASGAATIGYMPGDATFSAAAVANNVTSTGTGAASQIAGVSQANQNTIVQAVQTTTLGDSQNTVSSAMASANNVNFANEQGALQVGAVQTNSAPVTASAEEDAQQFGGATVSAQAVGNSTLAGNVGISVDLFNNQTNGAAGVTSTATFNGGAGFDAQVASTAFGNAATAFACSDCGGVMTINNSQTNGSGVSANALMSITGDQARSIGGVATAVGNSASFYVTTPH